ncbi:hypothetical protein OROHE_002274 [Orobanche hederae]
MACDNVAAPSPLCCRSLNTYIGGVEKQMLLTNRQAIICADMFGSMPQKGGILTDLYQLCDIDLKDFSLQAWCRSSIWATSYKLRELAGSGVPPYLRPNVWRLLLWSEELQKLDFQ